MWRETARLWAREKAPDRGSTKQLPERQEDESMTTPTHPRTKLAFAGVLLLSLAACEDGFDLDLRGFAGGFSTSEAARNARIADRPSPDARGVISYPAYDVAVARGDETVSQMAARLGFGANELGSYNGIPPENTLRSGEIIALPRRVANNSPTAPGTIDVTTLAGNALDRLTSTNPTTTAAPAATAQPEPVRHHVKRGETAYSISRRYGVSVRALAEWNSLDNALTVREGQYLLIPVVLEQPAAETVSPPGTGSRTPVPPSAATALPKPEPAVVTTTETPDLAATRTAASAARMVMPVDGRVAKAFEAGKTDGIDISTTSGATVRAARAGTVAAITRDTNQVPILVLRHSGNLLTVYAGIENIKVKKGQKVAASPWSAPENPPSCTSRSAKAPSASTRWNT